MLTNGKRCPNASLPGSKYCGVPAHQALVGTEAEAPDPGEEALEPAALEAEIAAVAAVEAEGPGEGEPPIAPSAGETGNAPTDATAEAETAER